MNPFAKKLAPPTGFIAIMGFLLACLSSHGLTIVLADESEADQPQETEIDNDGLIVFLDGSHLSGELSHIVDEQTIAWLPRQSTEPILLPIESIHRMLPGGNLESPATNSEATIHLTNGDTLLGTLENLDDQSVNLSNPVFGELTIPRRNIVEIFIMDGGFYLLPEIGHASDWVASQDSGWTVQENALLSGAGRHGTIMRKLPEADRAHISFELHYHAANPHLTVYLFAADEENPESHANYSIQINNVFIYARKNSVNEENGGLFGRHRNTTTESLGEPVRISPPSDTSKLLFDIKADLRRNIIELHIDGELVETWNDPRGLSQAGSAIGFTTTNRDQSSIRNLSVVRWHGGLNDNLPENATNTDDVIDLQNGDVFAGHVSAIDQGKLTITTDDFGEFTLPTSRIMRLNLANRDTPQSVARLMERDIRVSLLQGGTFVFQLKAIDGDHIHGYSENFGDTSILLSAIRNIEFNLYDNKPNSLDLPPPADPASLLEPAW